MERLQVWIVVFFAAAILFLRKTDSFINPQFWADDALPFFIDSQYVGSEAFLRGYAGYYHLLPRLIAWSAASFDVLYAPAIYVFSSAVVTLAVVASLCSNRLPLTKTPMVALTVVAVPHSGEIFLNPTNLQWITALALFATYMKRDPVGRSEWLVDGLTILLAGLSGPFSVLLLPFFAYRYAVRRTTESAVIGGLVAIAATVQLWEYLHSGLPPSVPREARWLSGLTVLLVRVPLALLGAPVWAKYVALPFLVGLGILVCLLLMWFSLRARSRANVGAMLIFVGILVAAAFQRVRFDHFDPFGFEVSDRYFVLPKIVLLWIIVGATDWSTRKGKAAAIVLVASCALSLPNFRFLPMRDLKWAEYCDAIRSGAEVKVPINPDWTVTFPQRIPH